jgi:hypothetical protein
MANAPYGFRLLVGATAFAVEETLKLPHTILMYPMTLVSQAAHLVMRFQQNLAELAIKGDSTLESIFPPKDENPEWATFDEDLPDATEGAHGASHALADGVDGDRRTEGRFALYSIADGAEPANSGPPANSKTAKQSKKSAPSRAAQEPAVAAEIGYPALTLAQLRARLQSLGVDELEALLGYEQATRARAPFQTLIANRITRATAK